MNEINGRFNWTMTYRETSEAHYPYGMFVKKEHSGDECDQPIQEMTDADLDNRINPVLWFVSHCDTHSGREIFADILAQHINVTIRGSCSESEGKGERCIHDCEKELYASSWFYLALENSICQDYVTEKFFANALRHNLIPIVQHRQVYPNEFPAKSFIAMDDFASASDMADHLNYLMGNRTAYREYFAWKQNYCIATGRLTNMHARCSLCDKLHDEKYMSKPRTLDTRDLISNECLVNPTLWNVTSNQGHKNDY